MSASAAAQAAFGSVAGQASSWIRQGLESFVAAQKILLDLTAQQNALAIGIMRERLRMPRLHVGSTVVGVANQAVSGVTGAGKILLDLAAGETALLADGLKDVLRLGPAAGAVTDVVRYRAETLIEMQRKLLDAVSEQMSTIAAAYDEGSGMNPADRAGELARRAIEVFVQTEKRFLTLVAEEVNEAANGKEPRKAVRDRSKLLASLAKEGVEKYIAAQKELLDLAIRQFEAGQKAMREREEEPEEDEEARTTFAEWTQKSVKNLIAAEKMLLELAIKPVKAAGSGAAEPVKPHARKRKKAASARA